MDEKPSAGRATGSPRGDPSGRPPSCSATALSPRSGQYLQGACVKARFLPNALRWPVNRRRGYPNGQDDGTVYCWRPKRDLRSDLVATTLRGHMGSVLSIAFARDLGAQGILFTASADRTIRVWDPWEEGDGAKVQTLAGHGATVSQVVYRRRTLLSCSHDGTVRVWQVAEGRRMLLNPWMSLVATIEVASEWATCMGIRSGERLTCFVGDGAGGITVLAAQAGQADAAPAAGARTARTASPVASPMSSPTPRMHTARDGGALSALPRVEGVTRMLVLGTEQFVVTVASDGACRVHDALRGGLMFHHENERRCRYSALGWTGSRQELVVGDERGWVEVWLLHAKKLVRAQQLAPCAIRGLAVAEPRGGARHQQLVVTSARGVALWEMDRDLTFTRLGGHEDAVIALAWASARSWRRAAGTGRGESDLVGSLNPALARLDDATRGRRSRRGGGRGGREGAASGGAGDEATGAAAARSSAAEAVEGRAGGGAAAAAAAAGAAARGDAHEEAPSGGEEEDEEARLVSASVDNTVRLWDARDMHSLYTLRATVSEISCLLVLEGAGLLVTGADDGSVRWWNPETGSNTVSCMCLAERRRLSYLVTGSFDGTVILWDVTRRRTLRPSMECQWRAHGGEEEPEVLAVAFLPPREGAGRSRSVSPELAGVGPGSARGRSASPTRSNARRAYLLTGGSDRAIRVWDLEATAVAAAEPVAELRGHGGGVTRFLVDGAIVYAGADDGSVRVWNMTAPQGAYAVRDICAHRGRAIRDLALVPEAGALVTCAGDGLLRVWDPASAEGSDSGGGGPGAELLQECAYAEELHCVAYRPARRALLAGAADGKIVSFRVDDEVYRRAALAAEEDADLWAALESDGVDVGALRGASAGK